MEKIDRTGEITYNSFGSEMIIKEYRNNRDINVYFPKYNWLGEHVHYTQFKHGTLKCPYEPRVFGKGYIGEGKYSYKDHKIYKNWERMLRRCYSEKFHEDFPTYKECECERLLCLQDFGKWHNKNYYEIEGEVICLDKDILCKGNKIYSPETCIYVPEKINKLFSGNINGVSWDKNRNKWAVQMNVHSKHKHFGRYDSYEKARQVYKENKEKYMKEVIDSYKGKIPKDIYEKLQKAIYNYIIE